MRCINFAAATRLILPSLPTAKTGVDVNLLMIGTLSSSLYHPPSSGEGESHSTSGAPRTQETSTASSTGPRHTGGFTFSNMVILLQRTCLPMHVMANANGVRVYESSIVRSAMIKMHT